VQDEYQQQRLRPSPDVTDAGNPLVQRVIGERLVVFTRYLEEFVTTLINSLDRVPYEIRLACKFIADSTRSRFHDISTPTLAATIGGAFMLRFKVPSIFIMPIWCILTS
jgi:hypothetical protein